MYVTDNVRCINIQGQEHMYIGTLDELVVPPPGAEREDGSLFDNVKGMLLWALK